MASPLVVDLEVCGLGLVVKNGLAFTAVQNSPGRQVPEPGRVAGAERHLCGDPNHRCNHPQVSILITGVVLVTGVVGNLATCVVIVWNTHMHTATNYYLSTSPIGVLGGKFLAPSGQGVFEGRYQASRCLYLTQWHV